MYGVGRFSSMALRPKEHCLPTSLLPEGLRSAVLVNILPEADGRRPVSLGTRSASPDVNNVLGKHN